MGLQNYEHDWPYFHVGISTTLLMFWLFSNKTDKAHQKWTPHLNCTSFEFWGWGGSFPCERSTYNICHSLHVMRSTLQNLGHHAIQALILAPKFLNFHYHKDIVSYDDLGHFNTRSKSHDLVIHLQIFAYMPPHCHVMRSLSLLSKLKLSSMVNIEF
jgi:hypothetical protein